VVDVKDVLLELVALTGSLFVLLAGVGVIRFPDLYARMHAATKASTLGIGLIGVAAAIGVGSGHAKALVALVFIYLTAPSAAHMIGRAAYSAEGIDVDLDGRDDLADLVGEVDELVDRDDDR
jgi:multicomponent Na+:H+ antiporter subunit G